MLNLYLLKYQRALIRLEIKFIFKEKASQNCGRT